MRLFNNQEQMTAGYTLALAIIFAFLAFYNTDAEVYLFPRIIACALVILSIILFIVNIGKNQVQETTDTLTQSLVVIWPGLLVGFVYIVSMETVGFYSSALLAFLSVVLIYGQEPLFDLKAFVIKLSISAAFMLVLYLLFWQGLNVRTPTGLLF